MDRLRRRAPKGLAALFIGSGTLHLLRPGTFAAAVPAALPAHGPIIAISGIAELLCAAGLIARNRMAGRLSAILLVAILPGNATMALRASADPTSSRLARLTLWTRLPLHLPLIWSALQSGRSPAPESQRIKLA
ncbi:MAG: DoxX family protein [Candidatus Limnocylindrales bacterium]